MNKRYCFLFICLAVSNSAQGLSLPESWFAGLGPEVNGYTRSVYAFGGGVQLGIDLNNHFSIGQKTAFFTDFESVRTAEMLVFFRYYLPWLHLPSSQDGPFAQIEAGSALVMEYGFHEHDEVFPHFSGGMALGWRFNLSRTWYVEPAVRIGYPYIWGVGVTAGIRFKQRTDNSEQFCNNCSL